MNSTFAMNKISSSLAKAVSLHEQGRLSEAEAAYLKLLLAEPDNVPARYQLALLCLQRGDMESGIAEMRRVVDHDPRHAQARYDLGRALGMLGRHEAALPYFRELIELWPKRAEAYFYLGMTLASLNRPEEALPCIERTVALAPTLAEAYHNLGGVLSALGRQADAVVAFDRALVLKADLAEARLGLANALNRMFRHDEAVPHYMQAIREHPNMAEAYEGLGLALAEVRHDAAAVAYYEKALALRPDAANVLAWLGKQYKKINRCSEALRVLEQAVALQPDLPSAYLELGAALLLWGRGSEAAAHLEHARTLDLESAAYSQYLFNSHYLTDVTALSLAEKHFGYGQRFEAFDAVTHGNAVKPGRRLKVGFVSGDFSHHPVGMFMAELLASLDGAVMECYAYANQQRHDDMTDRIMACFDHWLPVKEMNDEALAERILADGIDILIDLSGHTGGDRLQVFARKPAPVQVTYLGYFNTTGLKAMDYILGNRWLLPKTESRLYTEQVWHLPDAHLCFTPPRQAVEVLGLPALQTGFVTFGCFNKLEKINDRVVACWSRLMRVMPDSRLLLKSGPLADESVVESVRARFFEQGIIEDRLILETSSGYREYLESYNRVDVALDTFPYNGGATTVEALWMGVPVMVLQGDRYVAHMGESILHALNRPEWIGSDEVAYVSKAAALASDLPALATLRGNLRRLLLASPICDAPGFARNFEVALRGMWQHWCERQSR